MIYKQMQMLNIFFTLLLLLFLFYINYNKKVSEKAKTTIAYMILIGLMIHFMFLFNLSYLGLKKSKKTDFSTDLGNIKNTNYGLKRNKSMSFFTKCIDLKGNTKSLKAELTKNNTVIIKKNSLIDVKELAHNILFDYFGEKNVLNFFLDYKSFTPPLSVFNLAHLEERFFRFKLQEEIKKHSVIIFDSPKDNNQLLDLLFELHKQQRGKLFIILLSDHITVPKEHSTKLVECENLDEKEFQQYIKSKRKLFKGYNEEELKEYVGNDVKVIEELFEDNKKKSKDQLERFVSKYNLDLQLQGMDECKVIFLKNVLIEFYKLNHKTNWINIRKCVKIGTNCGGKKVIKNIVRDLARDKLLQTNGKSVKFYSVIVRNALMKYFEDSQGLRSKTYKY